MPPTHSQTLIVTASSSNTGLIPPPAINYTTPSTGGSIAFTPALFTHGTATITVTVIDGGASNNIVSRAFDVTVKHLNHAPTLDALVDFTINENAGYQTVNLTGIGYGAPDETDNLVVTATSSNPALIPDPTVNYTSPTHAGLLTLIPLVFVHGSATITVTVNDGGASNNIVTRSFSVTVQPVNQPPTLDALADRTINENSGLQIVSLSGIGTGAPGESDTLVVTASSSNPGLIPTPTVSYTSPNATGTISFAPVTNASGSAVLTVTVRFSKA